MLFDILILISLSLIYYQQQTGIQAPFFLSEPKQPHRLGAWGSALIEPRLLSSFGQVFDEVSKWKWIWDILRRLARTSFAIQNGRWSYRARRNIQSRSTVRNTWLFVLHKIPGHETDKSISYSDPRSPFPRSLALVSRVNILFHEVVFPVKGPNQSSTVDKRKPPLFLTSFHLLQSWGCTSWGCSCVRGPPH